MTENFDFYYTIISSVVAILFAYHKYLMKQLEKKVDKEDCVKQQELLAEKRSKLETLIEERTKTQFNQLNEIRDDLKIIKEYIAKN